MSEATGTMSALDNFFETIENFFEKQNEQKEIENDYNIITALLSHSDEVRLHSRFIYSLISPKGRHYKGTLFLEEFLNMLGVENFNYENAKVKKESENIDIYITDGCQHIIIENKIHAFDQKHQISRYIDTIKEGCYEEDIYDKILVVYLTLNSKHPSKSSLHEWCIVGNHLNNGSYNVSYMNITYKKHILDWLNNLLGENHKIHDNIQRSIESYKEVVEKLTKTIKWSKIMRTDEYLLEKDNFDKLVVTADLVDAFRSIKGKLLRQFFENIDDAIKDNKCGTKYLEEEVQHYSYENNDCDKWFTGRPRNYNIGTFFKVDNKPIVFGILVAQEKLYFVVRLLNDNEKTDNILKDIGVLNDKYKKWGMKKYKKKSEINLPLYCLSMNHNVFANFNKKETLSLLSKKESAQSIAGKCLRFVDSLSNTSFTE